MDPRRLDWSLLHSFLRIVRAGSLSAAARAHGLSQPTLGRHLRALEAALDQPLFTRIPTGQRLTPTGARLLRLLEHAAAMEAAAACPALDAAGASARLEGMARL